MDNDKKNTSQTDINQFPEAPASVTYSITSKGGFNILFTVRAIAGLDLLDTMESIEKKLIKLEYKPQVRQTFGGSKKEVEYVEGRVCPLDGGRLMKGVSKAGKAYIKCENGKYDFTTKQNTGCPHVEWK